MPAAQPITLRLTIADPLPGVVYSLQDKQSRPVGPVTAGKGPLSFDVPLRLAPGPHLLGDFVRSEGPARRFVYIAIGGQAGQPDTPWTRRAKIDIHDIPAPLLDQALTGAVLEATLPGKADDGGPSCGTVRPVGPWRVVG